LKREYLKKLSAGVKTWMLRGMFTNNFKSITVLLKNQNIDEDIIKRWEEYGNKRMFQRVVELFDTEKEMSESKIVTVCHGDTWSNNMLFTDDEESVTLIDFQTIGLFHPSRDLWYLLSVNTDREFRCQFFQSCIMSVSPKASPFLHN
jgi:thiamine kinase-like enzyme